MELNFNWSMINSSKTLASWFHKDREVRLVMTHNKHKKVSKHQPGGMGVDIPA
jgi:hypothetical protein